MSTSTANDPAALWSSAQFARITRKRKKETFDETRPLARRAVWPDAARTGDQGEGLSMVSDRVGGSKRSREVEEAVLRGQGGPFRLREPISGVSSSQWQI